MASGRVRDWLIRRRSAVYVLMVGLNGKHTYDTNQIVLRGKRIAPWRAPMTEDLGAEIVPGIALVRIHSCRDARMFPAPGRGVPKNCKCCAYLSGADADALWENGFGCRRPGGGDFILFNFNLGGTPRLKDGAIKVLVDIVPRIRFLPPAGQGPQIYALLDPFNGRPRYVGKSIDARLRLSQHLSENGISQKVEWIGRCLLAGRQPKLKILETVSAETWPERERFWIAKLRADGFDLLNVREGG